MIRNVITDKENLMKVIESLDLMGIAYVIRPYECEGKNAHLVIVKAEGQMSVLLSDLKIK